jgi:hypothetical protein
VSKVIFVLGFLVALTMSADAMTKAVVVLKTSGCSGRFVAESSSGYILMEWYGGDDPTRGDTIIGNLHSYGFEDIHNITSGSEGRVWIDDYMLSRSRVLEKLADKCG